MVRNGLAGLEQPLEPGGWVLDPFGSHPSAAIEAARAGYRVLVTVNNPVIRFMLEIQACAPHRDDFTAAISDLAAGRKGTERLERHIPSLYETGCASCGLSVPVDAFLWENGASQPYGRLYTCPNCGESGEQPVTEADLSRLRELPPAGLHRARALERVASIDDPIRADVEEAIQVYLPRPLYVIFTLINKLDTLPLQPSRRALLNALLLTICDEGSSLWPYPAGRSRPRQLSSPPRFKENNLWNSLEENATLWASLNDNPLTVTVWPEQAPPGGITLYGGRYRDIAAELSSLPIQAVLAVFPRPNQAFWTLSALWSGWLWGREAAATLRPVLSRKRYDWTWHSAALQSVLEVLHTNLPPQTPVLGIVAEAEMQFLVAATQAAHLARLEIQAIACREDPDTAQLFLKCGETTVKQAGASREAAFRTAVQDLLIDLGEPTSTLALTAAALGKLSRNRSTGSLNPAAPPSGEPGDTASLVHLIRRILTDKAQMIRYGGSDQNPENALWWLREAVETAAPFMDRVESEVVRCLQQQPGITATELDQQLCRRFPGPLAPSPTLVQTCLESYGILEGNQWTLRPEDQPAARHEDLRHAQETLVQIGLRLGYTVDNGPPVVWRKIDGQPAAVYTILVSAHLAKRLTPADFLPEVCWIVLPGGRCGLLSYKLEHNPRLQSALSTGWHILKFRRLFELANSPALTRELWPSLAAGDPPEARPYKLDI